MTREEFLASLMEDIPDPKAESLEVQHLLNRSINLLRPVKWRQQHRIIRALVEYFGVNETR